MRGQLQLLEPRIADSNHFTSERVLRLFQFVLIFDDVIRAILNGFENDHWITHGDGQKCTRRSAWISPTLFPFLKGSFAYSK